MLRAVAVMNVVIDDGHTFDAALACPGGAKRNVVIQAKAHGAITFGMMPRRPHQRECARHRWRVQNMIDAVSTAPAASLATSSDSGISNINGATADQFIK